MKIKKSKICEEILIELNVHLVMLIKKPHILNRFLNT